MKRLGIALALLNVLAMWFGVILLRNSFELRFDTWPSHDGANFAYCPPELLVYFDPWLAGGLFPLVYTLGFMAIAFLYKPESAAVESPSRSHGASAVTLVLLELEAVWLSLVAFPIFFRGPNWNLYLPWDSTEPYHIVLAKWVTVSELFWIRIMNQSLQGMHWLQREIAGLTLAGAYLVLGVLATLNLTRRVDWFITFCWTVFLLGLVLALASALQAWVPVMFGLLLAVGYLVRRLSVRWRDVRAAESTMPVWRTFLLILVIQTATLVPIKIVAYWALNWKYFIFLPEYGLNV